MPPGRDRDVVTTTPTRAATLRAATPTRAAPSHAATPKTSMSPSKILPVSEAVKVKRIRERDIVK